MYSPLLQLLPVLLLCCQSVSSWTLDQRSLPLQSCRPFCRSFASRRVLFGSSCVDLGTEDDEDEETNHLITAGHYFKGIDEDVGSAMIHAGKAWTTDWSKVAEALDQAAHAFWDTLSKKNLPAGLQTICRSVAQELEDISTIEGCSSVGPATSLPNWIAIHGYLESAAKAYEDSENQHIYTILTKTSREIELLIESI
jgi:hypothetical protein